MAAPAAPQNATPFPVYGQSYLVYGWINDATTGLPLTVGTLSSSLSLDGATAVSGATPVGVTGMTGRFYLELTADHMTAYNIGIVVSSSTTNQIPAKIDITTCYLSEPTGHWLTQTVKRLEQGIVQIAGYLFNKVKRNTNTGTVTMYKLDETTAVGTMARSTPTDEIVKGELT